MLHDAIVDLLDRIAVLIDSTPVTSTRRGQDIILTLLVTHDTDERAVGGPHVFGLVEAAYRVEGEPTSVLYTKGTKDA